MPQMTFKGLAERAGKFVGVFVNEKPARAMVKLDSSGKPYFSLMLLGGWEGEQKIFLSAEDVAGIVEDESGNLLSCIRVNKDVPK